ncbi:neuronal tyrosine-phosphorylated phosphoinositide-3-kinase adapter 1 [Amblyraja radiata]|uniref:neuronal tyrosine-phosphorylated phosphoinositide-3-kinase adapter 1 n=1 Tax=Amblyraja radiata TaxID=386614 RepID=UPI001403F4AE|nr:neuronal tyrosine-phosphorylated phosphoinositide-3-kinase adapter 1 [Amblyraja radiata]
MSSGVQDASIGSFLQYIEDKGLKAYSSLTGLGCGAKGLSHCLRHEMNLLYRKTKVEWKQRDEETKKSLCRDGGLARVRELASLRRHFRLGFMTMPAWQEHGPHPCSRGLSARSLSLHSVGSTEATDTPCSRQPTHPARHPARTSSTGTSGSHADKGHSGDKVPPRVSTKGGDGGLGHRALQAKSKFSQLSASFDDPCPGRPAPAQPRGAPPPPRRASTEAEEEEEPVYIEMVGDVFKGAGEAQGPDQDPGHSVEAIYEEMKYPLPEEGGRGDHKWVKFSAPVDYKAPHHSGPRGPAYDIPPPFPNLLLHRPPLLAFPQGPGQKGYQGGPFPCQPGPKVTLPPPHGDPPPTPRDGGPLLPSGRARSHSTPLPPQASGQHRPEKELPTSQTMVCTPSKALAQSPQPAPLPHDGERDKLTSLSTVKVTTHPLLVRAGSSADQRPGLSVGKAVQGTRPVSGLYKTPVAHGLLESAGPNPGPSAWPYLKRPPAYDSLRAKGGPAAHYSTVKVQGQERMPVCTSICCSRSLGTTAEARTVTVTTAGPVAEVPAGPGRAWQRKFSCGKKAKETEGAPRSRGGNEEAMAKEEKPSAMAVKAQGLDDSGVKGPSRTVGQHPCPLVCQWSADSALSQRLGRSASTSGVQHSLAQLQRQSSLSRDSPTQSFQQQHGLREKDGKLLEVIERKRCLCKEIKARRGSERSLCKQDSMPILPSWRKGVDARKLGTPPCQRQHAVLWDTAI